MRQYPVMATSVRAADSRRFMPDALRRFESLKQKEFFSLMLLADADFSALTLAAKEALARQDGLEAIGLIRKAEAIYEGVDWSPDSTQALDDSPLPR